MFGPGQSEDADMLIPSLSRTRGKLELQAPDQLCQFIHVDDLTDHLARFADPLYCDVHRAGQPGSHFVLPGTMTATPRQLKNLYNTWESYR